MIYHTIYFCICKLTISHQYDTKNPYHILKYKNELNFKNQPMIKAVYCENSKVPGVTFAENGIVEVVKLNNQTELEMIGLTKLREFSMWKNQRIILKE